MRNHADIGITFFEAVLGIILITIFAIATIPKILSLIKNTQTNAVTAIASSLTAANAHNYVLRKTYPTLGVAVTNCTDIAKVVKIDLPNDYKIISNTTTPDTNITCTLRGPNAMFAKFTATGIA